MSQEQLQKAFALMKKGDRKQAAQIVQAVIKQDRDNVSAWWLMANVMEDSARKQKAAEKVLSLDPNHAGAKKMMAMFNGGAKKTTAAPKQSSDPSAGKSTIEIEFDWSKLEEREAKKKVSTEHSESHAIRTASFVMIGLIVVVAIVLVVFVVIPSIQEAQAASRVEATMIDFMDAMAAGDLDTAETLVCEAKRRDQGNARFDMDVRPVYRSFEVDFSGVEIKVSDFTGDSAVAELSGTVRIIPTGGEPQNVEIDDIMGTEGLNYGTTRFQFVLENSEWRICANAFGQ